MRVPLPAALAGVAIAALGAAGLIRGAVPQAAPAAGTPHLVVSGAFVRAPAPPTKLAAAYFTVRNDGAAADQLLSVQTAAAGEAALHTDVGGQMVALATGAAVPAHGALVLRAGGDHVMLEHLTGTLRAGQRIVLTLTFRRTGSIDVTAPVIAPGAAAPTASAGR
jgi:copper(I)-binding protein